MILISSCDHFFLNLWFWRGKTIKCFCYEPLFSETNQIFFESAQLELERKPFENHIYKCILTSFTSEEMNMWLSQEVDTNLYYFILKDD